MQASHHSIIATIYDSMRLVLEGIEYSAVKISNAHLDSTLLPVRAGLVLFPAARPPKTFIVWNSGCKTVKLIISELFKFLSFTESGVYERDAEHIACTVTRMGYAYRGTRIDCTRGAEERWRRALTFAHAQVCHWVAFLSKTTAKVQE